MLPKKRACKSLTSDFGIQEEAVLQGNVWDFCLYAGCQHKH